MKERIGARADPGNGSGLANAAAEDLVLLINSRSSVRKMGYDILKGFSKELNSKPVSKDSGFEDGRVHGGAAWSE